jgi:hypothetical protein
MRNTLSSRVSFLVAVTGFIAGSYVAIAQQNGSEFTGSLWQFGLNGSGIAAVPSASFTELPGVVNCLGANSSAKFTSGSGGGFSVAAIAGLVPTVGQDFGSHIGYAVRLGYASSKTSFETQERVGQSIDPNGQVVTDIDTYTIDATLTSLRVEPMVTYQVGPTFPLLVELGVNLGLQMSGTYDQSEKISSPANARYIDGTTERNVSSGDLTDRSGLTAGISLGLGYDIHLSSEISLRPELSGLLGIGSPVSNVTWSPHEVRFGLSLLYTIPPEAPNPLGPTGRGR